MPKAPTGRDFYVATPEEIRDGRTTDVYFLRTLDILKKAGKDRTRVVAEVTAGTLPNGWPWGILCGVEEAVHLLTGRPVSLWSLPEGSLFPARTARGIPVPVMILEGAYGDWAVYETPVLGLICQASGIATKASRLRKLAAGKQLLSFGVRRMHPGIAPLIERSAYVAGADAITTPLGAELFGAPAMGTMPHALVIVMGGPREAFAAVHKFLEAKVPRIALVDTYYDEKTEALLAVEAIPDLTGVRLDTGLPPRQLPRDRAGGPLGTGPPRPQGRPDFRVRFGRREDDPGARRGGRRWIRRRHEPEQRADDRLRDGHRGGRGQAGGQAGQVRRPQGSAALSEGRDLRGRGADVCGVRLEDGTRLRPVSGQRSALDAPPVPRGHPAADRRRTLPRGPRNLTEPFIEPQ